jgi:hypothetical protein
MFKAGKEALLKFMREDLPVMGVDLIIGGVKLARDVSDRTAHLIADGTLPAPGFIIDRARERIEAQEDFYRVAEPEHGWEKHEAPPAAEKERTAGGAGKKKTVPKTRKSPAKGKKKTPAARKKSATAGKGARGKRKSTPRKKRESSAKTSQEPDNTSS